MQELEGQLSVLDIHADMTKLYDLCRPCERSIKKVSEEVSLDYHKFKITQIILHR